MKIYRSRTKIEIPASATVLCFFGWATIVLGIIAGFALGSGRHEFNIAIAIVYWAGAILSGTLLIAISKIMELLVALINKDYYLDGEDDDKETGGKVEVTDDELPPL